MDQMIDAMKRRISIRSYSGRNVEPEVQARIDRLLKSHQAGPFGNRVRISLINLSNMEQAETRRLGTYGVIKGAGLYMAAAVRHGPGAMEDTGYCFEQAVLGITALGLGTCWLGGTFRRAGFAARLGISQDEVIPVISPVGYAYETRTARDRLIRYFAGSNHRRPWGDLFFEEAPGRPLGPEAAGEYAVALECLRLGPSASNKQPWRVVKTASPLGFHLFLNRSPGYLKFIKIDLQRVDMGIAMAQFELAAREAGLNGSWTVQPPGISAPWEYVATWCGGLREAPRR